MSKILQLFYLILMILLASVYVIDPAEIGLPETATVGEGTNLGHVEELSQLQYDARYIFEQMIIPGSIFVDELETVATIALIQTANVEDMREHILSCWKLATTNVIWRELVEEQGEELPDSEAEIISRANELRLGLGLGDEHIVDVSYEEIDSETSAFIIQLLDTNTAWLSTYIGIAYNEGMGVRIFTLEGVQDISGESVGAHMFCFIEDGFRGSFHTIENNRQAFIDNVRDAMNGLIEPGARFPRP